jgi:SNF2 family DNA or RNA helicase
MWKCKVVNPHLGCVCSLQEALRPLLLRRMKEDVETLPEKEEVIVWVELTQEQRRYYKAIYSQRVILFPPA